MLDRFAADGYQLVLAGHTHGGQLCLPFYGALVTNCGLDRSRAKGTSRWGANMQLHVSAGIGTSPFASGSVLLPARSHPADVGRHTDRRTPAVTEESQREHPSAALQ